MHSYVIFIFHKTHLNKRSSVMLHGECKWESRLSVFFCIGLRKLTAIPSLPSLPMSRDIRVVHPWAENPFVDSVSII